MRALFSLTLFLILTPLSLSAQEADIYEGGPDAPVIFSVHYPDANTWYRPMDATFSWPLPEEVVAVAAEVTSSDSTEPMKAFRPPVTEINVPASSWQEGVQYVTVQFKNDEKWGAYTSRRVMIDATPPEPFGAEVFPISQNDQYGVMVKAETTDRLSGLSHFEISLNQMIPSQVSREELMVGYFIPLNGEGTQNLRIMALDQAGNARTFTTSVTVLPPKEVSLVNDPFTYASTEPASILVSLMTGILLLTFGYLVYERQRYAKALTKLREETDEVQEQMLKVFGALREEIYDQIGAINRKTRLTKKEKEAVEGLNKALLVSEKLLKQEVRDVKKLLN